MMPRLLIALPITLLLCLPAAVSAQAGMPQSILAADNQPTLVSLFLPSVTVRPTYRATQIKGKADKRRRIPTITAKPAREYRDLLNGFRVEYPNDWSYAFPAPDAGSSFAHFDWVFFSSSSARSTMLAVGVLDLKKTVTTADLQKNFADYTREPKYEEEFRNPRFLLMYKLLSSVTMTWNGRTVLDSVFTHRYQSRDTKERQIRIAAGSRIIVLRYSAYLDRFDRDLHLFEDFKKSFGLLK
ncbi:MAG: hypothetical protein PHX87_00955 [Candidatus Peribacteraceae bacterium]|nr:hypothetical protein [Candidatus Peribacteraceae bacterium]MDD5741978.1 hypothetical protein [Candidatus Peribacteraceae bacterium]